MVHGVLHLDGTLSLDRVECKINEKKYIELLKDRVLPILNTRYGENFTWQCDNATPHTCATTKKFFEENKISILKCSANSPDMSPIDLAWKILKDIVYQKKYLLLWQNCGLKCKKVWSYLT